MQNWTKIKSFTGITDDLEDYSYSAVPLLVGINQDKLIVSKRSKLNKSLPFIYSFDKKMLEVVLISKSPILELGLLGEFDEDGIMPVCSLNYNSKIFLYYIGWNLGSSTPFRNSIGLAFSEDDGYTFKKMFNGPILDRSIYDPCFVASCCVIHDQNMFKMWYLSCDKWIKNEQGFKHKYNIKYAFSSDGINWVREGLVAIDYLNENEYAISVPRVIIENGIYKMWYSYRGNIQTYRIGYAESNDSINWIRKDDQINLNVSTEGWDSEMICYPFLFHYDNERFILYNGNGYGRSGVGAAKLLS